MKRLIRLFCLTAAMLWALPVSALNWDQDGQAVIDFSGPTPQLVALDSLSIIDVLDVNEYSLIDVADYQADVEIDNAVWDDTTATDIVIDVFDEDEALLATGGPYEYILDTLADPDELTIDPSDLNAANSFVNGLPTSQPDARLVQLKARLYVDVTDCLENVILDVDFRYNGTVVAEGGVNVPPWFCP